MMYNINANDAECHVNMVLVTRIFNFAIEWEVTVL